MAGDDVAALESGLERRWLVLRDHGRCWLGPCGLAAAVASVDGCDDWIRRRIFWDH